MELGFEAEARIQKIFVQNPVEPLLYRMVIDGS